MPPNLLDDLLDRWEDARRRGEALQPEDLCRDCPNQLSEFKRQIAALQSMDARLDWEPVTPAGDERYRPLHLHARGGLGEVYLATDERLHRPVAVKRVRPRHAGDDECRSRFLREAEITARLQHPGVVPVYDLTAGADGQPSYVMRFVDGESLEAALGDRPPADCAGVHFRGLLARFVTVCNTIAYAHTQGIVHRDIKPANILLGRFGETVVADWGLAKSAGGKQPEGAEQVRTVSAPIESAHQTPRSPDETQPGSILGTPAYMSPEQAAGDDVGPASDIYGLGATLYHLLTGRPPLAGDWPQLRDRISRGEFPRPRQVNAPVPADLEAVCLKAMALRPTDRYPTADALAADLERWLADQPVIARRPPFTVRAARWSRQHRPLVTASVAVLAVGAAALGIGLAAVEVQRRETVQQRDVALEQKRRSREALDFVTSGEALSALLTQQKVQTEQAQFLQTALAYYEDFAHDAATDEQGRAQRLAAYLRVGGMLRRLQRVTEAEAAYRQAAALAGPLAAEYPDRQAYRRDNAGALSSLAMTLSSQGRIAESLDLYRQALQLHERLAADYPDDPNFTRDMAVSRRCLGLELRRDGQAAAAIGELRQSAAELTRLSAGGRPADRSDLIDTLLALADMLYILQSAHDEALAVLAQAQVFLDGLSAEESNQPSNLRRLMELLQAKAGVVQTSNRPAEALTHFQKCHEIADRLSIEFPAEADYRRRSAECLHAMASQHYRRHDYPAAEAALNRSLALYTRLRAEHPDSARYKEQWLKVRCDCGSLYRATGRLADAETAFREVLSIQTELVRKNPTHQDAQVVLAAVLGNLGSVYRDRGDAKAGLESIDRALGILEKLYQADPNHFGVRDTLCNWLMWRAGCLLNLERPADALADIDRLLSLKPQFQRNGAELLRGQALVMLGRLEEGVAIADRLASGTASADTLYWTAGILATAASKDPTGPLADRAMARLNQAVAQGCRDGDKLRHDDRFNPLRSRNDFQQLMTRLDAASRAESPRP